MAQKFCFTWGTKLKFNPPVGTDVMLKGGVSTAIGTRLQCITTMAEYTDKSFEELRFEDYIINRNANMMNSRNATLQKGLFASNSRNTKEFSGKAANSRNISGTQFKLNVKKVPLVSIDASTQTQKEFYVSKLLEGLKKVLHSSKHSDFVLNVKGKEFKVHKVILEAHSPVFAAMIEHDTAEKATGMINIDCDPLTITHFLNFLYTGKVENLNLDNIMHLYEMAHKYDVAELSDFCIKYMINNISVENYCDILTLSLRHQVRELEEVATQFFQEYSKEIVVTHKWGTFLAEYPVAGSALFLKVLNLKKE